MLRPVLGTHPKLPPAVLPAQMVQSGRVLRASSWLTGLRYACSCTATLARGGGCCARRQRQNCAVCSEILILEREEKRLVDHKLSQPGPLAAFRVPRSRQCRQSTKSPVSDLMPLKQCKFISQDRHRRPPPDAQPARRCASSRRNRPRYARRAAPAAACSAPRCRPPRPGTAPADWQ